MSDLPEELKSVEPVIDKAIADIMEHVDSVRIFVTKVKDKSDEGTLAYSRGSGNWFAQYGQIKEWCVMREQNFADSCNDDDEGDE